VADSASAGVATLEVVVVAAEVEEEDELLLAEVIAGAKLEVLVVEVVAGGVHVEVGGSYCEVGLGAGISLRKSQLPYMIPTSVDAKYSNRPSEKSSPPQGHPGHCGVKVSDASLWLDKKTPTLSVI
jgi:hypothetical protein